MVLCSTLDTKIFTTSRKNIFVYNIICHCLKYYIFNDVLLWLCRRQWCRARLLLMMVNVRSLSSQLDASYSALLMICTSKDHNNNDSLPRPSGSSATVGACRAVVSCVALFTRDLFGSTRAASEELLQRVRWLEHPFSRHLCVLQHDAKGRMSGVRIVLPVKPALITILVPQ